jgi:conjugal transfer mating pair stabilization protein TraN
MKNLKKLVLFLAVALTSIVSHAQSQSIQPGTAYCKKFSEARPASYCIDSTPCKQMSNGGYLCLAGASSPPAGAQMTSLTCWSMATDYTCMQYFNTCATFTSDANCTEIGTKACTLNNSGQPMTAVHPSTGACSSYTRNFSCIDPAKPTSTTTSTTSCDTTGMMDGLNWSSTKKSSADDFVKAATGQEFARQLAAYGSASAGGVNNMFPGIPYNCADGYIGLKNCCKSSGGGVASNNSVLGSVALSAFKNGAGYAIEHGSYLVYDFAASVGGPAFMVRGAEAALNSGQALASGFGAFGFGTTASAAAGLAGSASATVANASVQIGSVAGSPIYFNPYALAAAIAIQVIMEAISCKEKEKELAILKGNNLCHYVGTYCSGEIKLFGSVIGCYEDSQTYCCYNGLLAKAIEEVAHDQLGISWGSAKEPNCAGLSVAQLTALNLDSPAAQAALEPFKQQIMKNFNQTTAPALANGSVVNDIKTNATSNAAALCQQRKLQDPTTVCN